MVKVGLMVFVPEYWIGKSFSYVFIVILLPLGCRSASLTKTITDVHNVKIR